MQALLEDKRILVVLTVILAVLLAVKLTFGLPWWTTLPWLLLVIIVSRRGLARRWRERGAEAGEHWAADLRGRQRRRRYVVYALVAVLVAAAWFSPGNVYWIFLVLALALFFGCIFVEGRERERL